MANSLLPLIRARVAIKVAFQRVQHGNGLGLTSGKPHLWVRTVDLRLDCEQLRYQVQCSLGCR